MTLKEAKRTAAGVAWVLAVCAAIAVYATTCYLAGVEVFKLAEHLTPRAVLTLAGCYLSMKLTDFLVSAACLRFIRRTFPD